MLSIGGEGALIYARPTVVESVEVDATSMQCDHVSSNGHWGVDDTKQQLISSSFIESETVSVFKLVLCSMCMSFVMPSLAIGRWRHGFFDYMPQVRYLVNRSSEFHHIYSRGAVGVKDELSRVWGQKVKGQGHGETK